MKSVLFAAIPGLAVALGAGYGNSQHCKQAASDIAGVTVTKTLVLTVTDASPGKSAMSVVKPLS
jgi:hypothetical protein